MRSAAGRSELRPLLGAFQFSKSVCASRAADQRAALVTFNYDRMLDEAAEQVSERKIRIIDDYT